MEALEEAGDDELMTTVTFDLAFIPKICRDAQFSGCTVLYK